jgi:hypothetical protein
MPSRTRSSSVAPRRVSQYAVASRTSAARNPRVRRAAITSRVCSFASIHACSSGVSFRSQSSFAASSGSASAPLAEAWGSIAAVRARPSVIFFAVVRARASAAARRESSRFSSMNPAPKIRSASNWLRATPETNILRARFAPARHGLAVVEFQKVPRRAAPPRLAGERAPSLVSLPHRVLHPSGDVMRMDGRAASA